MNSTIESQGSAAASPHRAKKKRVSTTRRTPPRDGAQFAAEVNEAAALQLELEHAQAALNELLNSTGTDLRERIDALTTDIEARLECLHGFAHTHRAEIFPKGKKTGDTTQATFGFSDNPPRLSRAAEFSEEDSISALLKLGKAQFVRTVREVNKDAIKEALREAAANESAPPEGFTPAITVAELRMCGLKLSQTERFWLEPRRATETPDQKIATP
jgi:phage host-nuclease inhibitor protein Gam